MGLLGPDLAGDHEGLGSRSIERTKTNHAMMQGRLTEAPSTHGRYRGSAPMPWPQIDLHQFFYCELVAKHYSVCERLATMFGLIRHS